MGGGWVSCNQTWLGCPGFLSRFSLGATLEAFVPEVWKTWFGMQRHARRSWFAECLSLSCIGPFLGSVYFLLYCLFTCKAQRWCTNLAMVGKWRICLRPSLTCWGRIGHPQLFGVFFCLPQAFTYRRGCRSTLPAAKQERGKDSQDSRMARHGKTKQTHPNAIRLRFFLHVCLFQLWFSPLQVFACQTWGSKI